MRILFVTPTFPSSLDPTRGIPNFETARSLAMRHEVVVIAHLSWLDWLRRRPSSGGPPRVRTLDGIEIHHPVYYYPPACLRTTYTWFLWRSIRPTVRVLLSRFVPDVVLAGWVHPDGDSALRAAALAGAPCVQWSGGSDVLVLPRNPGRRACVVDVLRRSDAVVCVSEHLKRAINDLGVSRDRIHVVRNGLDHSRFLPGDRAGARERLGLPIGGKMLLWVGRMVPVKGVDVLIDACAVLRKGSLDLRLCLVGDGPLRRALASRVADAGLEDRVTFAGDVLNEALADWYRAADLTVLPSYSEGVPNVLYESMCCGTPFVASAVGGVPEIADPGLDRLVSSGDVAGLADAIRFQLLTPLRSVRAHFPGTWEEHGLQLEAVLEQAITDRRLAGPESAGSTLEPERF